MALPDGSRRSAEAAARASSGYSGHARTPSDTAKAMTGGGAAAWRDAAHRRATAPIRKKGPIFFLADIVSSPHE